MATLRFLLRLLIYSLIYFTFALGMPSFHYVTALMVVIIIRYKDEPDALMAPVSSQSFVLGRGHKTLH